MTDAAPPAPADTGVSATPAPPAAVAPTPSPTPAPTPSPSPAPAAATVKDGETLPESITGVPPKEKPPYVIPDAYKDKPWAAKIKSEDDLYKQIDNLTTLVGKKVVVPDLAKATDAEREEYYAQTRPADVTAYQFGDEIDPAMKEGMGASLLKNGVSAVQANAIIADYQAAEKALLAEQFNPEGIKKAMEPVFGKDWEKAVGHTKNLLSGLMTPDDNALIDNLPNPYMALVYRTLSNVIKAYGINESSAHVNAPPGGQQPPDIATKRESIRNEIAALRHKPHTAADKQVLIDQLNKTYEGVTA